MSNAHAWRHRNGYGSPCSPDCPYCKSRPSEGKYRNQNGHRSNPTRKKGGRHNPEKSVKIDAGRSVQTWVHRPKGPRGLGS